MFVSETKLKGVARD